MGLAAPRSYRSRSFLRWGAPAIAASTSPTSWSISAATLPATSSWTRCSARAAASGVITTGSGSYSTWTSSAASSAT